MIRVLIVDDAEFIRDILKEYSRREGWVVVSEADNGESAVLAALQHQPDIIFMDLVLPKMNGIDAIKKISEKVPQAKIIATSTLDQESIQLRAIESGCCSFLPKPFKFEHIKSAVESAMRLIEKEE